MSNKLSAIERLYQKIAKASDPLQYTLKENPRTPLRIRIITYAFFNKLSLDEVCDLLYKHNCEMFYVRNIYDATLRYAFIHQLNLQEWIKISNDAVDALAVAERRMNGRFEGLFCNDDNEAGGTVISYKMLNQFYSQFILKDADDNDFTMGYTDVMMTELDSAENTEESFKDFLADYLNAFVPNRQRSRRIFIKELLNYLSSFKNPKTIDEKYDNPFMDNNTDRVSVKSLITNIDDFYFNLLLVNYEMFVEDANATEEDVYIIKDNIIDNTPKLARGFKNYLRDILFGQADITRTFFIVMVLFFRDSLGVTLEFNELNNMLMQSGFKALDEDNENGLDFYAIAVLEKNTIVNPRLYIGYILDELIESSFLKSKTTFLLDSRGSLRTIECQTKRVL